MRRSTLWIRKSTTHGVARRIAALARALEVDTHRGCVRGGEEPLDGEQAGDGGAVASLDVRWIVDDKEEHGQEEEGAEAAVELGGSMELTRGGASVSVRPAASRLRVTAATKSGAP